MRMIKHGASLPAHNTGDDYTIHAGYTRDVHIVKMLVIGRHLCLSLETSVPTVAGAVRADTASHVVVVVIGTSAFPRRSRFGDLFYPERSRVWVNLLPLLIEPRPLSRASEDLGGQYVAAGQ